MAFNPPYTYAWQNPVLCETIYPYRLEKLRDFLLVYEEIDLWARLKDGPVDPALEKEIRQNLPGLQAELQKNQNQQKSIQEALSLLVKKLAQIERLPELRKLVMEISQLQQETAQLNVRRRLLEGYITWSLKVAPLGDPVRPTRQAELDQVLARLDEVGAQIASLKQEYDETFQPLKEQEDKLEQAAGNLAERTAELGTRLQGFPLLTAILPVTPRVAARWLLNQYRQRLEGLDQEALLALVLERFESQPERYPAWLKYMVIHFSGMRYKSAHGSWADPRLLLQKILVEELEGQINSAREDQIRQTAREILTGLQNSLAQAPDDIEKNRLTRWIQKLAVLDTTRQEVFSSQPAWEAIFEELLQIEMKITASQASGESGNPPDPQALAGLEVQRRQAVLQIGEAKIAEIKKRLAAGVYWLRKNLLAYRLEHLPEQVARMTDADVLSELSARKSRLPHWAWDEIVRHTDLRLLVNDPGWETPTRQEQQEKFNNDPANQRWRQLIHDWVNKDITAWRAKNAQDLSLIVTRAVCNEISEHIQHLRGRKPPGGLTAKPQWYLANQDTLPGKAFFKQPTERGDFLPGASLLFLGWVTSKPHAWAIASPLRQFELQMPDGQPFRSGRKDSKGVYQYQLAGSEIYRTSQVSVEVDPAPPIPPAGIKTRPKQLRKGNKTSPNAAIERAKARPKKFRKQLQTEWLRWTHEAMVVEVAEMIDGTYVLTFETGEIGLNIRPINHLIQEWDVYLGYVPPAETKRSELAGFIDRAKLLPKE